MPSRLPVCIQTAQINLGHNQTVLYPQAVHMPAQRFERFINQKIFSQTQQLINEQVENMPSTVVEMLGLYEIKNNQRQVISLSLSNYTYHYQAAHGMTYIKSLTFDLVKEKLCELKDLFIPGSNYVQRLSLIIDTQIQQRNIPILHEFTMIRPDQDFYIADKALIIYFQLYEITPYVFGFPMFPISVFDIEDIIDENGPLGRMDVNN